MTILVFHIGGLDYFEHSKRILGAYAQRYGHSIQFVHSHPLAQQGHPSWLKLLAHTLVRDDFILCWDADLLPLDGAPDIAPDLDKNKLCMALDMACALGATKPWNEKFRFNGGLLGLPNHQDAFARLVFNNFPGARPSYEQYYLNDAIIDYHVDVHVIPQQWNTFYYPHDNPEKLNPDVFGRVTAAMERAFALHYTWAVPTNEKIRYIARHP
jgi:hypothetical protein